MATARTNGKATQKNKVENMNIHQRIFSISMELGDIPKNLVVHDAEQTYNALSEVDVKRAVKKLEEKYRVLSYPTTQGKPVVRQVLRNNVPFTEWLIEVVFRFVNIDNPDDFIEVKSWGQGIDAWDKGAGKAMTYASKYALINAYKICGSVYDDPDAMPSNHFHSGAPEQEEYISFSADPAEEEMVPVPADDEMPPVEEDAPEEARAENAEEVEIASAQEQPEEKSEKQQEIKEESPRETVEEKDSKRLPATLDDALKVVYKSGKNAGKTFKQIFEEDYRNIQYLASDSFREESNPVYKQAARIIVAHRDELLH